MFNKKDINNLEWSVSSWRSAEYKKQMPIYTDENVLATVKNRLRDSVGLVSPEEVLSLKADLKEVGEGNAIIIQGGDCAEDINSSDPNRVTKTVETLKEMESVLSNFTGKKIIKIGRMAGQYAKPRSSDTEIQNGVELPSYRGDIINNIEFTKEARNPDPLLMEKAYNKSVETINLINKQLYVSHEALLLEYEESLVRKTDGGMMLASTHLPWIGDRTRSSKSAHVEFLRGVINPIGIKCGPATNLDDLVEIIKILNPTNEKGKIILIIRMGAGKVKECMSSIIAAISNNNLNVVWISDAVHGNGKKLENGFKTRYLSDIMQEIAEFTDICKTHKIYMGGIHLEMTGLDVTECIGGSCSENNIASRYETLCDPRLNREQCLRIANFLRDALKE
jgi:3-deoxy-7-phosphoheptulonate synthase